MNSDPESIVDAFGSAWLAADVDAAMTYCHPNIRVTMHYHDLALPFSGSTLGWEEARTRLKMTFKDWTPIEYHMNNTLTSPDTVRSHVPTVLRHNRSRALLEVTFRQIWKVTDGKIISFDGYTDIHLIKSFLRLVESRREKSRL